MLKHIKPRDILEFFLFGFGILALIFIAGFLEEAPLVQAIWVAVGLSVVLWLVWFYLVTVDRNREAAKPTLWMSNGKEWVAQDGSERTQPFTRYIPRAGLFDQDADAIKDLDFEPINTKEQA